MDEVPVTVVRDEMEAEMLCALLRENNIRCYQRKTNFGVGATDLALSGFGPREIIVLASDLERAREIIAGGDGEAG
jgi:hypothetical protein